MGEPVIKQIGRSNGQVTGTGRTETPKGESTRATTSGTETGRTTGSRAASSGTATGTTEKEVVSGLANVDPEQKKRDERNARRRELYAKKKAEQGKPVKTRKPSNSSKASETVGTEQVTAIISTVSTLVASRPNMAHWQLTPTEIESLSKPISNLLSNSDAFKEIAEHSDAVALVTACFTIFLPRMILTVSMQKERKKNVRRSAKPVSKPSTGDQNRKDHDDSGKNDTGVTDHGTDHGESEFYYGDPVSI